MAKLIPQDEAWEAGRRLAGHGKASPPPSILAARFRFRHPGWPRWADVLSGGPGFDTSLFRALADSTAAARDTIAHFGFGDEIDLSLIDANSKVRGNHAFSFHGGTSDAAKAGSLYCVQRTGLLWGDFNGDNKADFSVKMTAGLDLDASDFLL